MPERASVVDKLRDSSDMLVVSKVNLMGARICESKAKAKDLQRYGDRTRKKTPRFFLGREMRRASATRGD